MSDIIRCIIVDDEPMAREILGNHLSRISSISMIGNCKNAMEAFHLINSTAVDLVLLDINMPEISGLSFAKTINKKTKIIFTTAHREYAVDGFDLQAIDYLLKPISFDRLLQAIDKFSKENANATTNLPKATPILPKNDFIFVRSNRKMVKIHFSDINYIESMSDYIKIHTDKQLITSRETISSIEAKLIKNNFMRIHRSFIIHIAKISSFTNEFVEINNKALPISRSYKKGFINRLGTG